MSLANTIRSSPFLSTLSVATALSFIWHGVWLGVFFLSTFIANIETPKYAFIMVLWLSAAAESVVRFTEGSTWAQNLISKPRKKPILREHDFRRTRELLMLGLLVVFLFSFLASPRIGIIEFDIPGSFVGLENSIGTDGAKNMVLNWWYCLTDFYIYTALIISVLLRAVIYKKRKKGRA